MSNERILVHSAGTKVTCQVGHHVCTIISDLYKGEERYAKCIGDWQIDQRIPQTGDNLPLLCKCGHPYTGYFPQFPWTISPRSTIVDSVVNCGES